MMARYTLLLSMLVTAHASHAMEQADTGNQSTPPVATVDAQEAMGNQLALIFASG